jgi:hypothetical protein
MADALEHQLLASDVVASIEEAVVARRAPRAFRGLDVRATDQLLGTMQAAMAIRFAAAARLELRQKVALFTITMLSLYFVGVSIVQAVYANAIAEATIHLLALVSVLCALFMVVLALTEATSDRKTDAYHLRNCALRISDLHYDMRLLQSTDIGALQDLHRRFTEAVRTCAANPVPVDGLIARAARSTSWVFWGWAWCRYGLNVFGLCLLALAGPVLALILLV